MSYTKMPVEEIQELEHVASSLEDAEKYEIFEELISIYKQGKIDGLESAFEKHDLDINLEKQED